MTAIGKGPGHVRGHAIVGGTARGHVGGTGAEAGVLDRGHVTAVDPDLRVADIHVPDHVTAADGPSLPGFGPNLGFRV